MSPETALPFRDFFYCGIKKQTTPRVTTNLGAACFKDVKRYEIHTAQAATTPPERDYKSGYHPTFVIKEDFVRTGK